MAAKKYFGDDMTATVETSSGTSLDVALFKGVTVVLNADHVELRSADSTLWDTVKKRNFSVNVTVNVAAFDVEVIHQWLGGSGGSTSTGYVDDSSVQQFNITGTLTPTDGGTDLTATVEDVYFAQLPVMDATENEYVVKNLNGTGKNITGVTGDTT